MIKQLALVIILVLGIAGTVFVVQKATQFNSQAFNIFDFVSSFHSTAGDPHFNSSLDINGDGKINVMDVLKDRYSQEATRSGTTSDDLSNILDASDSADTSDSAD